MAHKILNWFRYFILLSLLLRLAVYLLSAATGGRVSTDWVPFAVICGFALLYAGRSLLPRVIESRWMYGLYRYHSPAKEGMLARPPLTPGFFERLYLRVRPPRWCRKSQDDLMLIYREQDKLMREGAVALGVLVQANVLLFRKGSERAAPASVIYTTDGEMKNPVPRLLGIAEKLFSLKGTKPEEEDERRMARIISYDYGREFRVSVPESLSQGFDVTYTTIMIHRKHLPFGYISGIYFPLLIHQESRAAMILPARYWPEELVADWTPRQARGPA